MLVHNNNSKLLDGCSVSANSSSTKTDSQDDVVWNNGWRTKDGKFASPRGAGRAGEQAEQEVWKAVKNKPKWDIIEGRVYSKNSSGQIRVYDGVAKSPRGYYIGLEVKSGSARRTAAQTKFDLSVGNNNPAIGIGMNAGIEIRAVCLIRK